MKGRRKSQLEIGGIKDLQQRLSDWEHLDVRKGADIRLDLCRYFIPVKSNTYDLIYSSHTLEHIYMDVIEDVLREICRILKPGGIFRVTVPDMKKAVLAYINEDARFWQDIHGDNFEEKPLGLYLSRFITTVSLNRYDSNVGQGHVIGWDFETLKWMLEQTGFENVVRKNYGETEYEEFLEIENNWPARERWADKTLFLECSKSAYSLELFLEEDVIRLANFIWKIIHKFTGYNQNAIRTIKAYRKFFSRR